LKSIQDKFSQSQKLSALLCNRETIKLDRIRVANELCEFAFLFPSLVVDEDVFEQLFDIGPPAERYESLVPIKPVPSSIK
jgi:hypothetical protein